MTTKDVWLTSFLIKFWVLGLLIFSVAAGAPVLAATENITQVKFITEPQTILPNVISEVLTVQTQNSNGEGESLGETADLFLQSSSPTGEFSSSKTNWLPPPGNRLTMAKGTSKRNFYYRDTTEGSYTLTATVKTRTGGHSWETTQPIIVSVEGAPPPPGGNENEGGDGGNGDSGHSGQGGLSEIEESASLMVGAGRPRLTTIASPVTFKALVSGGEPAANLNFVWSFGDGAGGGGRQTEHIYQFPGTYIVVVNVYQGDERAVSRTTVRVIDPALQIVKIEPLYRSYIEIANPSDDEVNLMSWRLAAGETNFVFPLDTILPAKTAIKYPLTSMNLPLAAVTSLTLKYPNGWEAATRQFQTENQSAAATPTAVSIPNEAQLAEVARRLAEIQTAALKLRAESLAASRIPPDADLNRDTEILSALPAGRSPGNLPNVAPLGTGQLAPIPTSNLTPLPAPTSTVVEIAKPPGFFRRGWSALTNIFSP